MRVATTRGRSVRERCPPSSASQNFSTAGRAWRGRRFIRSPMNLAPRTSPISASRVPASPSQWSERLLRLDPLHERVADARVGEITEHLEDLLGLEPCVSSVFDLHAVEREHQALAADAVAERLEEFLAAVLVGVAERLEQRTARRLVGDLAEPVGGLAADLGVGVLDELDERARPLGLGVAREHRGDELPHARALVAGELGELVERHQAREELGVEAPSRRRAAPPW